METKTIVGYLIVKKEHIVVEQFEVASWYTSHRIAPGRYPVYSIDEVGIYGCPVTKCVIPTTIIDDDRTSMFCSEPINKYTSDRIGGKGEYTVMFGYYEYPYMDNNVEHLKWATFEPVQ